ncbi:MAG: helix-turn-helix domain-containing protein [Pseudomonadota bacterium]
MDVVVYVSPGFNLTGTLGFTDAFQAVDTGGDDPDYTIFFTSDSGGDVASKQGPRVETIDVDALKSGSDIVVVSTADAPNAACGAPLAKHLRYWQRQDGLVLGLESGAYVLADGGFLEGSAAIHPRYASDFAARFPSVPRTDGLFTTAGATRTCVGGAAATDFALSIIAEQKGAEIARQVRDALLAQEPRQGTQRVTGGAASPLIEGLPPALETAIARMRGSLDKALSVPELSAKTGMSQRQVERLFKFYTGRSPNQYYRMLRLDRAREMVTRGTKPMPEIATACGFQSSVHFSRAYKEQFGVPPMRDRVNSRLG